MWLAEDAARELPNLPLEDLLQLVHLYAERGSPKYEKAAMRWLKRYLTEGSPGSSTSRRSRRPLPSARQEMTDDIRGQRPETRRLRSYRRPSNHRGRPGQWDTKAES
jgi:hypothetical protein